jgi:hypothetical protein
MPIDTAAGGPAGEGRLELGRDGKLTNDHPYVSAVVLLRRRELATDAAGDISAEVRARFSQAPTTREERVEQAAATIKEINRHKLPEGHYFYVDVIETASESAVPLPEQWFDGPRDTRWRLSEDGAYELVRGAEQADET